MHLLSEHRTQQHIFSRADARLKLLVCTAVLVLVLSHKGFGFPLFVLVLGLLLCALMRVPLKAVAMRFAEPVFLACMLVFIKAFFTGHEVLFSVPVFGVHLTAYQDGLAGGLLVAARIMGAVSVIVVLGFAASFTEVISALAWLGFPKSLSEILLFAYRYIFMLLEDAMTIYHAQKNRMGYASITRGMRSFGMLTGALMLKAFEHSQKATVAMVQRGYDGSLPVLQQRPFQAGEVALSVVIVLTMGVLWKV